MERHVDLFLLSVGTEVSNCVCHLKFLGNHLMSRPFTLAMLNLFTIRNRL